MEEARNDSSLAVGHGYEQKNFILEAQRQKESQLCFIDKQCHLKNEELEPNLQKYKERQRRAPGGHCKRRL